MKLEFKWNKTPKQLERDKTGGKEGCLTLANVSKRLMDPYVPANELILAQNVRTYVEGNHGVIHYNSPYAHYQYVGEVYGPNYPVMDGDGVAGFYSPPHKNPTGAKLQYSTFPHSLATDHWDQAMMVARKADLVREMQNYLKRGGK